MLNFVQANTTYFSAGNMFRLINQTSSGHPVTQFDQLYIDMLTVRSATCVKQILLISIDISSVMNIVNVQLVKLSYQMAWRWHVNKSKHVATRKYVVLDCTVLTIVLIHYNTYSGMDKVNK
jgi:hypothetical protein